MKLAYETPKMKAELFQANQYVAGCKYEKLYGYFVLADFVRTFAGITIGNGTMDFTFRHNSEITSKNQYQQTNQYYYVAEEDSSVYLEWSQPYQQFVLYKEAGATSGFYDNGSYGGPDTQIYEGSTTLQTNDGSPVGGWGAHPEAEFDYQQPSHEINRPTSYLYQTADGTILSDKNGNPGQINRNGADYWISDHCMGAVDVAEGETWDIINS